MFTFAILAALTLASAVAAMSLRNLVHCALALAASFAGLAAIYLQLDAEFVGFAQILVYIGAVAILIVIAILLTRGSEPPGQAIFSSSWLMGLAITVAVFAVLGGLVLTSKALPEGKYEAGIMNDEVTHSAQPSLHHSSVVLHSSVRQLGDLLMTKYILPLEVVGLLLTTALIGAVLLARQEPRKD